MKLDQYAAEITAILDEKYGEPEYPESFECDVEACFQQRLGVKDAARKLALEYDWTDLVS